MLTFRRHGGDCFLRERNNGADQAPHDDSPIWSMFNSRRSLASLPSLCQDVLVFAVAANADPARR